MVIPIVFINNCFFFAIIEINLQYIHILSNLLLISLISDK